MGVFSASFAESFDYGYIPELEVNDYNAGALASDNFAEMAILGSVETTAIHKSLVESLAGQEIAAMEEGYEVIYEASSLASIGNKIRELIQKAIEKLKNLFEKVIAVFKSWTSSDKQFIKTYGATFTKNWIRLKKLDMKVFKYNSVVQTLGNDDKSSGAAAASSIISKLKDIKVAEKIRGVTNDAATIYSTIIGQTDYTDFTKIGFDTEDKYNNWKEDNDKEDHESKREKIRGFIFDTIKSGTSVSALNNIAITYDKSPLTAKEFSDELYDWYRSDENSKENMDKSDLEKSGYSSDKIMSILTNGEKTTQNLSKCFIKLTKDLKKEETEMSRKITKQKYNDTSANKNKIVTAQTYIIVQYSGLLSIVLECIQTWQGQWLQACKEYSRTCKSIATKVVAMGEKRLAQEESWDYGYDNDYSDSFMNAVVIK